MPNQIPLLARVEELMKLLNIETIDKDDRELTVNQLAQFYLYAQKDQLKELQGKS